MTRTERTLKAIAREERRREQRPPKAAPERTGRRHRAKLRICWDRPLPHEVRA